MVTHIPKTVPRNCADGTIGFATYPLGPRPGRTMN